MITAFKDLKKFLPTINSISLRKKDTVVGIDIGSASVKIANFRQNGTALEPAKTDFREINLALEANSREAEVVSVLKELLKGVNRRTTRFVATVNCPNTAVRQIHAPHIPKNELKEAIRLHAAQYFPFPIDKASLDFEWPESGLGTASAKDTLLVATAPEDTVRRMTELLGKAGVLPLLIVPTELAIGRAFQNKNKGVLAILDVGYSLTEFVILSGKEIVFSRAIPVAGKDFTQSMTVSLATERGKVQLSVEDAERIKRLTGIPSEGEASRLIEDKISTAQILSMLRAPLEQLSSEIERCFDYYREESGGGKIDSLILCGGSAELKGLDRVLSSALGLEVRLSESHRFSAAQGAALSVSPGFTINLLPPEIKERTQRSFKRATVLSLIASAVLFCVFIYIGMSIRLSIHKTKAATAEMELTGLKSGLEEASTQRLAAELMSREPYWEDILKELAGASPRGVYLTRLRFQDRTFFLSGSVVSGDRETQVTEMIRNLEQGLFSRVRLVTSRDVDPETGSLFEINCGMDQ